MDFNSDKTRSVYSDRQAADSWKQWAKSVINPKAKAIADLGCGGGIYSKGFYELGAASVILVDNSAKYAKEARKNLSQYQPTVKVNSCTALDIPDEAVDIVFERAVIHHLSKLEKGSNLREIFRILKPSGHAFIQDRTYQDVIEQDSDYWIRNTLFECFPHLLEIEQTRRPDVEEYEKMISQAGLTISKIEKLPEIRKTYSDIDELLSEVLSRKGKSILFKLTDGQLDNYCQELKSRKPPGPIVEQDLWTVWNLKK